MYILAVLLTFFVLYILVQSIRCYFAVKKSEERLLSYDAKTATFDFGTITYMDEGEGEGEVILSVHGIFGGYDQAFETVKNLRSSYRVIAPSRFGYLGSDILGSGAPAEQATALVKLLDKLGVEKVYILGTSAGGTTAIRFALDYPERIKGLILYSSAMPLAEKPKKYAKYIGPPAFLCNNYMMFLLNPLFKPIMGMDSSTIYSMLPIGKRKDGVVLDSSITNPDMARDFDSYKIEEIQAPTLIFHAEDDKIASFKSVENVIHRFPQNTFVSFKTGGHLMEGHSDEIENTLSDFILNIGK